MKNILLLIILLMLIPVITFAQEITEEEFFYDEFDFLEIEEGESSGRKGADFWIGIGGEVSMYSYLGLAYGGSFALGYGSGSSIGLKATWFFNEEGIDTLELNLLLRLYFFGRDAYSGPFIQLLGGPSLYNRSGNFSVPSTSGMFSAGLGFGWRFVFFDRLYVEPAVRGGYPYVLGAGISAGIRF